MAKAFLANLHYACHDFAATIETCDDIFATCGISLGNNNYAEKTFPVLLSTEWAAIYDNEIQAMLGFHSLCAFLFDLKVRSRSVCLCVCPILFAHYLKIHCFTRLSDFMKYLHEIYAFHVNACQCQANANIASIVLVLSLQNWKRDVKNLTV